MLPFDVSIYFIYTYIISLLTGRYELNKLTSLPMCGFIAQLVEHRTGIAEVTGSNPVEALIFFRLLLSSCLNWKIHCEDHSSLSLLLLCCRLFRFGFSRKKTHRISVIRRQILCFLSVAAVRFFFLLPCKKTSHNTLYGQVKVKSAYEPCGSSGQSLSRFW